MEIEGRVFEHHQTGVIQEIIVLLEIKEVQKMPRGNLL